MIYCMFIVGCFMDGVMMLDVINLVIGEIFE